MLYNSLEIKNVYTNYLNELKESTPLDDAMKELAGSLEGFDEIGKRQLNILRYYGLEPHHHLIEVGCGSGRLAKQLSPYLTGMYSGFDIIDEAVDYASKLVQRPDWTFESIDYISIPEPDGCADMVCFFSVFTHLLNEEIYFYLEEAIRVLKPGGKIVFSFLEFSETHHGRQFFELVNDVKLQKVKPITVYGNREEIAVWAKHLILDIEDFRDGSDLRFGTDNWESICVLSAPKLTPYEPIQATPQTRGIRKLALKILPHGTRRHRVVRYLYRLFKS